MLEHLLALEAFVDNSIVAGFSCGVAKAQLLKTKAALLGNLVGRFGSTADVWGLDDTILRLLRWPMEALGVFVRELEISN